MKQHRDSGKTADAIAPTGNDASVKKPYVAPVLVEYGTIAKLTQGSLTQKNDGVNTKQQMKCL